jgi:CRISPR-associated endoribonuclease Cas6
MRIKIEFKVNNVALPIANQEIVNSYVHRIIGANNPYHNAKNDYSVSSLMGGKLVGDKIIFKDKAYLVFSSLNMEFMNTILMNLITSSEVLYDGIKFSNIVPIGEEFMNGWNHFATLSPFLIKQYVDKKTYTFITLNDDNFEVLVKEYLKNKLLKIDPALDLKNFDVRIPKHDNHKVKKILVKNVINHANQCHISIFCDKKIAELLYNIGIGQSTGSGFGTIYKTENKFLYK